MPQDGGPGSKKQQWLFPFDNNVILVFSLSLLLLLVVVVVVACVAPSTLILLKSTLSRYSTIGKGKYGVEV